MKELIYEDIIFKVGQNSKENWDLLSENDNFMWFHLASFPSCYVICCDEDPTSEMILYASKLCKENTKYRNLKNLRVNYTPIKNLKKGEVEGMVYIKSKRKVNNILV